MTFFLFFIFVPFVNSDVHTLITTYTGIRGVMTAGLPEFSAVTSLDEQQIDYYDGNDQKLIPRQDWMKKLTSQYLWSEETQIRRDFQAIYKNDIADLMERLNQKGGVHVYQRIYGCWWDDRTNESDGFDQYGYDGDDYVWLDLKEGRYITPVKEGNITVDKWNKNKPKLEYLQHYYRNECIEWVKELLKLSKAADSRAPEVFLIQKSPSSPVVCRATGLHTSGVNFTLFKNDEKNKDVDLGELLPNGDGTFQKNITLYIPPDDWKMHKYVCVVEHMGKTIQKILTEDDIKSNKSAANSLYALSLCVCLPVVGVLLGLCYAYRNKRKINLKTCCIIFKKQKDLTPTSENSHPLILEVA